VVISEFDIVGSVLHPHKADAVLVIDADAVLSGAISVKRLKTISGGYAQVLQSSGRFKLIKLAKGDGPDALPAPVGATGEEFPRVIVSKALNHVWPAYNGYHTVASGTSG
jgi:hypothetical protein